MASAEASTSQVAASGQPSAGEPPSVAPGRRMGPRSVGRRATPVGVAGGGVVLAVAGASTLLGLLLGLGRRGGRKKAAKAAKAAAPAAKVAEETMAATGFDLTPFGSPVGGTPVRLPGTKSKLDSATKSSTPMKPKEDTDRVDTTKDQKVLLSEVAELQKQLKLMQIKQDEDTRTQQFLEEYKAQAEVLKRMQQEREEQQSMIMRLEGELKDLKTRPTFSVSNGAELELFKGLANSHFAAVARSVCSDAEHAGKDTNGSVDNLNVSYAASKSWTRAMQELFQSTKTRMRSPAPSQPTTPRGRAQQQQLAAKAEPRPEVLYSTISSFIDGKMM